MWPITHASSTAAVDRTSLRLSAAVASSAVEPMPRPSVRLNSAIQSFTAMDSTSTTTSGTLSATAEGWRILSRDDLASSTPMTRISAATPRPVRYSIRAWP